MSETNSSKSDLSIVLEHNDGVVRAQGWLKGAVIVETTEVLEDIDHVTVQLIGREMASTTPSRLTLGISTTEEAIIFNEKQVFNLQDCPFEPGTYEYPFSIYLPGSVPASMSYEDSSGACAVEFTLGAIAGTMSRFWTLTVVGAPLTTIKYPRIVEPTIFPVRSLKLIDQGYIILSSKVENTHIGKGCTIDFSVACRNRCTQTIQRIEIRCVEQVSWKAKSQTFQREIVLADFPNVPLVGLLDSLNGTYHSSCKSNEVDGVTYAELQHELASSKNTLKLSLPLETRDSYSGKLLTVSHFLKVCMILKENSHSNPKLMVPLQIFDPPIIETSIRHTPKPSVIQKLAKTEWPAQKIETLVHHSDIDSASSFEAIREDAVAE